MIHSIKIDADIDERIKEFNAKLPPNQKVVSFTSGDGYLFLHVEVTDKLPKQRNLLLEEFERRGAKM